MDDLPQLFEPLMAFVAVVDAGGFNAAGNRSGVPPSRLSRSVSALEQHLGVSLLVRSSRRFEVTDIGRRTYEDAVATRGRLQDAVAAARRPTWPHSPACSRCATPAWWLAAVPKLDQLAVWDTVLGY